MFVAPDECCRDLSLVRSPDLFDGIEIRRIRWKICKMDIVAGGVLPDHDGMIRAEVIKDNNKPFIGIRSFILSRYFPDIFLFGALPEGDNRRCQCRSTFPQSCRNVIPIPLKSIINAGSIIWTTVSAVFSWFVHNGSSLLGLVRVRGVTDGRSQER